MTEKEDETAQREPPWLLISIRTAIVILLIFALIAYLQYELVRGYITTHKDGGTDLSAFGLSGDFFGLSNAVFSALAFAMIIVTLWMQNYELKQQREELTITRDVFKQQQLEMKQQNESLNRQTFENTFFGMLRVHSEIVAAVTARSGNTPKSGREAFGVLISNLGSASQEHARTMKSKKTAVSVESYEAWYLTHEDAIGHYFRTLYNMMRYIHESAGEQRRMYARLVRAQLSSNELQLLLYNGLCRYGKDKFKPLMEEYALLKHLRESSDLESWRNQYEQSAFGSDSEGAE